MGYNNQPVLILTGLASGSWANPFWTSVPPCSPSSPTSATSTIPLRNCDSWGVRDGWLSLANAGADPVHMGLWMVAPAASQDRDVNNDCEGRYLLLWDPCMSLHAKHQVPSYWKAGRKMDKRTPGCTHSIFNSYACWGLSFSKWQTSKEDQGIAYKVQHHTQINAGCMALWIC